jgi:hypothetical protein
MIKEKGESSADMPQLLVSANIRMLRWPLTA